MRALLTTTPLAGHLYPMVPLAEALQAAGHEVLVAGPGNFAPVVTRSGLPFTATVESMSLRDVMAPRPGEPVRPDPDPASRLAHTSRAWGRLADATMDATGTVIDRWRPDLVIHESVEFAGPVAATVRGIPVVEHGWGLARVGGLYRGLAGEELAPRLASLGLPGLPAAAAYVDPCPPSLRPIGTQAGIDVRLIPHNGEAVVPGWLLGEPTRPLVGLTLGASLVHNGRLRDFPALLEGLARALAGDGLVVAVAVDDSVAASWGDLPAGVVAAGRLPMTYLATHCSVVISHGGAGSVTSAVCAGTPQVVLPQTGDQFANGACVEAGGLGLTVFPDDADPDAVVAACRSVLSCEAFTARAVKVAAEVMATPPPSAAVVALADLASCRVAA